MRLSEIMLSKGVVVAAGAGLCFLGYCVYFDRKRRNDPLFKQKLREKRRKERQQKQSSSVGEIQLPTSKKLEDLQNFFLQQVQIGEDLMAKGDIDGGLEHLCTAVAVCGHPEQLLQVFRSTMPPQVFQLLMMKLPAVSQRISKQLPRVSEEDVE